MRKAAEQLFLGFPIHFMQRHRGSGIGDDEYICVSGKGYFWEGDYKTWKNIREDEAVFGSGYWAPTVLYNPVITNLIMHEFL